MDVSAVLPRGRRRARRTAALLLVAGTLLATVGDYWLATSATTVISINPTPGLDATTGLVADVSSLSSTVTCQCDGKAEKQTGVGVSAITIAETYAAKARVTVAWTDPQDANKVLDNPNAQILFGLYHPVAYTSNDTSGGTCSTSKAVTVHYGSNYYCSVLDTGATGSSSEDTEHDDTQGELMLSKTLLTGFLVPSVAAPGSPAACAEDVGSSPSTWCTTSGQGTDQLTIFVVASILTPGGRPKGQRPQAGSLSFYVSVSPTS